MLFSGFKDVIGPGMIFGLRGLDILALVLFILVIALIESLVLRALKWGDYRRCLLDAILINLVSTLAGLLLIEVILGTILPGMFIAALLSIVIEGLVLMLLRRHPVRLTWLAAGVVNLVSYTILALIIVLAGSLT